MGGSPRLHPIVNDTGDGFAAGERRRGAHRALSCTAPCTPAFSHAVRSPLAEPKKSTAPRPKRLAMSTSSSTSAVQFTAPAARGAWAQLGHGGIGHRHEPEPLPTAKATTTSSCGGVAAATMAATTATRTKNCGNRNDVGFVLHFQRGVSFPWHGPLQPESSLRLRYAI